MWRESFLVKTLVINSLHGQVVVEFCGKFHPKGIDASIATFIKM